MGGVGQSLPTGKQVNLIKGFLPEETAGPLSCWDSERCWGKIRVSITILEEKKTRGQVGSCFITQGLGSDQKSRSSSAT